ncbi:MAG: repair protein RecO protein [Microgenomates group bacterium GW2011_GWA1_46_15]|nr:MAG: repair protein RecO protein [Microgenomates group bacterium GW2011_GWA1_46_15]
MRTVSTEGIVLKRMNVGEADRFVTIFTRDLGKISALAKGVRTAVRRWSPERTQNFF